MTQYPETVLATEIGLSYGAVGLVSDFDAGIENRPDVAAVTQEAVFEELARHLPRLRAVIRRNGLCGSPSRCSPTAHTRRSRTCDVPITDTGEAPASQPAVPARFELATHGLGNRRSIP